MKIKDIEKKKMTMGESIQRIHVACEYYDMIHDTGDQKQNTKNKNYIWEGYNRLVEICYED